ncbi:MAG: imidazole glycerol-phosphate synthase subunit HisH, partial [Betaproteobacteria bacterium]|nr:imidazole glycerol-phosphate synthase subunit HisH [Betaproteobacteria bacterium]
MSAVLVDMQISNLASVRRALEIIGVAGLPRATKDNVAAADAVLLPGVGAFGDGMASLREQGLVEPIRRAAKAGVPVFGICLGMQLLADESEEFGKHEGLGLVPGKVRKLPAVPGFRVPNIGWCDVTAKPASRLFPSGSGTCYHVHSFHLEPKDPSVVSAAIDFGGKKIA